MKDRLTASWLALDIGGANLKAAHSSGQARSLPFELWKRPDELAPAPGRPGRDLPPGRPRGPDDDGRALRLLPDQGRRRPRGRSTRSVARVPGPAGRRLGGRRPVPRRSRRSAGSPALAAAANWLALATLAARLIPPGPGLLIDIGSTTTDLIPLTDGRAAGRGRTDTERLQTGELVYAGVRRTPLCSLATELPFRGVPTGLTAELFATTLDVYLTLGEIPSDPRDLSTADGRPATADAARDRLARMVGADREGFTADDALAFARAADEALLDRLEAAADRACRATVGRPAVAVVAGSGEFLARRLARAAPGPRRVGSFSLAEEWGIRRRVRPVPTPSFNWHRTGLSMPEHERREGQAPAERDLRLGPQEKSEIARYKTDRPGGSHSGVAACGL